MSITAIRQNEKVAPRDINSYDKSNLFMKVRCDNCGSSAKRHFTNEGNMKTECPVCDHWTETGPNGEVIDTSHSGRYSH